jgi:hypothetical protein
MQNTSLNLRIDQLALIATALILSLVLLLSGPHMTLRDTIIGIIALLILQSYKSQEKLPSGQRFLFSAGWSLALLISLWGTVNTFSLYQIIGIPSTFYGFRPDAYFLFFILWLIISFIVYSIRGRQQA